MLSIRLRTLVPISLLLAALCLPACKRETPAAAPAADPAPAATPATPTPAAGAPEAPVAADPAADFDPNSVPETTATLPPFPFFKLPDGLESTFDEKDKTVNFDRHNFIAGKKAIAVEGRIFHDRFNLTAGPRQYTDLEFRRNYENAIAALGGKKINDTQYTYEVMDAAGGRDALEKTNYAAGMIPNYPHDIYLIRSGGKEYWIDVSTGALPLHGYVVVLEREVMKQSLGLLDAAAMKQAIDKDGRVALYINFDTDKATLRPDAQPTVAEIGKLLSADPALRLSIEGHTDNTGTATRNQELSTARARSVLGALVGLGIDPARLQSKGFGQDKPVADNANEDGRAKNRRVELVKL
ncbi:MAG: OmpA family protein [Lysobacter sp.]|nr:OmpA family protein [Lysobacter sp.]